MNQEIKPISSDVIAATRIRYRCAGMAHSAADYVTASTGTKWHAVFRPRGRKPGEDQEPFILEVVERSPKMADENNSDFCK